MRHGSHLPRVRVQDRRSDALVCEESENRRERQADDPDDQRKPDWDSILCQGCLLPRDGFDAIGFTIQSICVNAPRPEIVAWRRIPNDIVGASNDSWEVPARENAILWATMTPIRNFR